MPRAVAPFRAAAWIPFPPTRHAAGRKRWTTPDEFFPDMDGLGTSTAFYEVLGTGLGQSPRPNPVTWQVGKDGKTMDCSRECKASSFSLSMFLSVRDAQAEDRSWAWWWASWPVHR